MPPSGIRATERRGLRHALARRTSASPFLLRAQRKPRPRWACQGDGDKVPFPYAFNSREASGNVTLSPSPCHIPLSRPCHASVMLCHTLQSRGPTLRPQRAFLAIALRSGDGKKQGKPEGMQRSGSCVPKRSSGEKRPTSEPCRTSASRHEALPGVSMRTVRRLSEQMEAPRRNRTPSFPKSIVSRQNAARALRRTPSARHAPRPRRSHLAPSLRLREPCENRCEDVA